MPLNKLKIYNQLLEIGHLSDYDRKDSLLSIFKRDIEDNEGFNFRKKLIRPVKGEEPSMQILFRHLTTVITDRQTNKREFEIDRAKRLHWVKFHIEENKKDKIEVFSTEERAGGKNVFRTYILDKTERYVIVLEPYRTKDEYYLLTAYYLLPRNFKKLKNKMKRKLDEVLIEQECYKIKTCKLLICRFLWYYPELNSSTVLFRNTAKYTVFVL